MLSFLYETLDWMLNDHFSLALRKIDKEKGICLPDVRIDYAEGQTGLLISFRICTLINDICDEVEYFVDTNYTLWFVLICKDVAVSDPVVVCKNVKYVDAFETERIFYVTDDNILHIQPEYNKLLAKPNTRPITFQLPCGVRKCVGRQDTNYKMLLTMDNLLYRVTPKSVRLMCPDRIAWLERDDGELYCTIHGRVFHNDRVIGDYGRIVAGYSHPSGHIAIITMDRTLYTFRKKKGVNRMSTSLLPPTADDCCIFEQDEAYEISDLYEPGYMLYMDELDWVRI